MSEAQLLADVRLMLGREPDVAAWRLSQGVAEVRTGATRRFGLVPGAADILAIVGPTGRWLAIETKSARGRPSPEQLAWGGIITRLGGVYAICRTVAEAREALTRAREPR